MGKILLPSLLVGSGLLFVILSVILGFVVVPNIIDNKIEEEVSLVEGSETWEKWIENPVPIYIKFYFFNVTNADEVNSDSTAIPHVEQVGPYVFREERVKEVYAIDEEEDTIWYRQPITYFYEEGESGGRSLDDTINVVNLPLMAVATNLYSKMGPLAYGIVDGLIVKEGEHLVTKDVTIGGLTFHGYPIPKAYGAILALNGDIPPEFADDSFGFYKGKNGTDDGLYKIYAGIKDTSNFGKIIEWENSTSLNWWRSPNTTVETQKPTDKFCNMINGTDGGIFAPFIEKDTIVRIFVTDICRSIHFVYENEEEHQGINGYKFAFPDEFYTDPAVHGDNYCFCPTPGFGGVGKLDGSCTEGVIRIFHCQNDAPIVTSSPHFLKADPQFREKVSGLDPEGADYNTYAVLEPNSGMLLKISKKLQINVEMQNFQQGLHPIFHDIENYLFPIFWADESAELDEANADDLKGMLLTPLKIVGITKWVIIGLGTLLVAAGIGVFVKRM